MDFFQNSGEGFWDGRFLIQRKQRDKQDKQDKKGKKKAKNEQKKQDAIDMQDAIDKQKAIDEQNAKDEQDKKDAVKDEKNDVIDEKNDGTSMIAPGMNFTSADGSLAAKVTIRGDEITKVIVGTETIDAMLNEVKSFMGTTSNGDIVDIKIDDSGKITFKVGKTVMVKK